MEDEHKEGIDKFIKLMRDLTQLIHDDPNHQHTVYDCLDSQELKRLFESIHDEDSQLRMTAVKFVCHLLHSNARIVELMGLREGCGQGPGIRKYILGGLEYYKLSGCDFKRNFTVKQPEIVPALNKLKYQPNLLAWALDLKTFKLNYLSQHKQNNNEPFPYDPKHYIVGIFIKTDEVEVPTDREKRGSLGLATEKTRHKIGKK